MNMNKEMQTDLFEQSNQRAKKRMRYPSLKQIFPYGLVNIRLSYEGIIFSSIIFLLICVVIFSLGMERGRILHQKRQKNVLAIEKRISGINHTDNASLVKVIPKPTAIPSVHAKTKSLPRPEAGGHKSVSQTEKYRYTIQVFAYKDRAMAMEKTEQLVRDGYKPFIIYSRNLYQICIGKYLSKENAKRDLSLLSKKYGSGYIRNMPQ